MDFIRDVSEEQNGEQGDEGSLSQPSFSWCHKSRCRLALFPILDDVALMPKKTKKKQKSGSANTTAAPHPAPLTAAAAVGNNGGGVGHGVGAAPPSSLLTTTTARTGLSPELEHISLEREKENLLHSDLSNLMATAQDLFAQTAALTAAHPHAHAHPRSVNATIQSHTHSHTHPLNIPSPEQFLSPSSEYWSTLPPSVKSFIRSTGKKIASAPNGREMTESDRQQALNSIMRSIMRGQHPLSGAAHAGGGGTIPGAFPDWTGEEWETYARGVGMGLGVGDYIVGPEGEEPELEIDEEEEYFAEDDPDAIDDEDLDYEDEQPELSELHSTQSPQDSNSLDLDEDEDGGKDTGKKSKKKKKRSKAAAATVNATTPAPNPVPNQTLTAVPPSPNPTLPPTPAANHPYPYHSPQPIRTATNPTPQTQQAAPQQTQPVNHPQAQAPLHQHPQAQAPLHQHPQSQATQHAHPTPQPRLPPSSRAAGKQPMAYAPTTPQPTQPTNPQPTRTATTGTRGKGYTANAPGRKAAAAKEQTAKASQSKLWSTNPPEERARIKAFWLSLGELDRRELVQVEKDAVLRKMKEQQKHSCGCAVCGRKRHAIEEELEVLYEAYYEELESYASYQRQYVASGGPKGGMPPPPPGPFPGSVEVGSDGSITYHHTTKGGLVRKHLANPATRKAAPNRGSEFEDDDDEEEEGEDDESEDNPPPQKKGHPPPANPTPNGKNGNTPPAGKNDIFSFGSSFTAAGPGNIITVADDLLKNDGQKFLEMMESLAERRMMREDEAAMSVDMDSEEEDEDEEGDEEDEEEEGESEEEEVMTEEQRIEEGKRMFSIFAARMFEQRVLQAYREKRAQDRQMELLRELEEESKAEKEKEEKKAKESAKKKEKKKLQKQVKDEEKARREADRAAEEAALKEKQEALEEEQKKKREEERIRREAQREAQRKAQEEERAKKDEEKRKRAEAERERQLELERKKKEKEEQRKEREEKERRLREEKAKAQAAARKEREDREREEKERKEREEKAEREAKEKLAKEQALKEKERAMAAKSSGSGRGAARNTLGSGAANKSGSAVNSATAPSGSGPKKILTKPQTIPQGPATSPSAPLTARSQLPPPPITLKTGQPLVPPMASGALPPQGPGPSQQFPPPSAITPQTPSSSSSIGLNPPFSGVNGLHSVVSPRPGTNFSHLPGVFNGAVGIPVGINPYPPPTMNSPSVIPPGLAPSAVPRGFGAGTPSYDPPFPARPGPHIPPAAIAPPTKLVIGSPLPTPASPNASFSSARMRGSSVIEGFGAVQRPNVPIAPIARPVGAYAEEQLASGSSSRLSNSPVFREEVLGSAALRADDDDIIVPSGGGRRIGVAPGSTPIQPSMPDPITQGSAFSSPWSANPPQGAGFPGRPPSEPTWGQPRGPGPLVPPALPSQGWNPAFQDWFRPHEPPGPHTGT